MLVDIVKFNTGEVVAEQVELVNIDELCYEVIMPASDGNLIRAAFGKDEYVALTNY